MEIHASDGDTPFQMELIFFVMCISYFILFFIYYCMCYAREKSVSTFVV